MSTAMATAPAPVRKRRLSPAAKRVIGASVTVLALIAVFLGTKIVPAGEVVGSGAGQFDAESYGEEQFPVQQAFIEENAVDAPELAAAIATDPVAAGAEYGTPVNSGASTVMPVRLTGVVGEVASTGYTPVTVEGLPEGFAVGVQLGSAINGTELRDVTGDIRLGDFSNQIQFQDAAAALNDQLRLLLEDIDTAGLAGQTITVEGAFTLINPQQWNVTPASITVGG